MLREEHLLGTLMKMKLGAVLKFKTALTSKVGSCPVCLHCIQCHTFSNAIKANKDNGFNTRSDNVCNSQSTTSHNCNDTLLAKSNVLSLSDGQTKMSSAHDPATCKDEDENFICVTKSDEELNDEDNIVK